MSDSPWFPFFTGDWIAGTILMTREEQGVYVFFLSVQWEKGFIPGDVAELERLAGVPVTDGILEKFPICGDGRRRNVRLVDEREFREKQRQNGGRGGRPKNPNKTQTITQTITQTKAKPEPKQKPPQSQSEVSTTTAREGDQPCIDGYWTLATAIAAGGNLAIPEEVSRKWWLDRDGQGWAGKNGAQLNPNAQASNLKSYWETWRANDARPKAAKNGGKTVDRNAGTLNDPNDYA